MKMLIVTDEGENVVIAGMPANKAINKRYKCIICKMDKVPMLKNIIMWEI